MYPRASLTERFYDWINELLYKIMVEGSAIPGGWFTITVLLIILVIAAVVAVRVAMRTMRTNRGHNAALFDSHELTSAEHRATAEQYAAQGDWAAAIRHRLRAVARHLEETSVLDPVPGRTATELARDAAASVPELTAELRRAAVTFNDVTYGDRPGTENAYRTIADLDDHLRSRRATGMTAPAAAGAADAWAEIR
jgi:Domain of unknown function (DUF4129)